MQKQMYEIEKIILSKDAISSRVKKIANQISIDYKDKDLVLVGILKGAIFFIADLIREISIPITIDFISIFAYGSDTDTAGIVKLTKDLEEDIKGRHVILVEDFVDTGITLSYLIEIFKLRQPESIKICTLISKEGRREKNINLDYTGFILGQEFLVGYGMDYNEEFRHLSYIATLNLKNK